MAAAAAGAGVTGAAAAAALGLGSSGHPTYAVRCVGWCSDEAFGQLHNLLKGMCVRHSRYEVRNLFVGRGHTLGVSQPGASQLGATALLTGPCTSSSPVSPATHLPSTHSPPPPISLHHSQEAPMCVVGMYTMWKARLHSTAGHWRSRNGVLLLSPHHTGFQGEFKITLPHLALGFWPTRPLPALPPPPSSPPGPQPPPP
jgi:hypothetical protein